MAGLLVISRSICFYQFAIRYASAWILLNEELCRCFIHLFNKKINVYVQFVHGKLWRCSFVQPTKKHSDVTLGNRCECFHISGLIQGSQTLTYRALLNCNSLYKQLKVYVSRYLFPLLRSTGNGIIMCVRTSCEYRSISRTFEQSFEAVFSPLVEQLLQSSLFTSAAQDHDCVWFRGGLSASDHRPPYK